MANYTSYIGATVICNLEIRNSSGVLTDPATSIKILINRRTRPPVNVIDLADMTKSSTGIYYYDFQTVSLPAGEYEVYFIATDGTRKTISKENLKIE